MVKPQFLISVSDIRAAAARLRGRVLRTPLRHSSWLSGLCGTDVFLKLETLQPTFSFKIRGALNAVLTLVESYGPDVPPLVTASAGNHGRALAYAASTANLALTVYVPERAPRAKLDAIRESGATLTLCRDYDEAEVRAKAHGATGTALFVSPYSHPDVIAGAGTIGLEILEDEPRTAVCRRSDRRRRAGQRHRHRDQGVAACLPRSRSRSRGVISLHARARGRTDRADRRRRLARRRTDGQSRSRHGDVRHRPCPRRSDRHRRRGGTSRAPLRVS